MFNYKANNNYTTHTKLDYKPPLSLQFNGKELMILQWGEVKRDKLDSNIFDNGNENKAYYRIYSKDYDSIDTKDIPKLLSSYSLTFDVIDTEKYYKSHHLKEQDILDSMKQDTSLPEGEYFINTKDIEESLKIQTNYLYTKAKGYKALNIYTLDTPSNLYKISYHNNPLDNIPYPKGTTFILAPNTPIPTHYTDEKVKIFLKGDITYQRFILKLKQKIDNLKTQGYEIDKVKLEVEYEEELSGIEIIGKNGMDISLISEYSKNILKHITQKSGYNKVVISSTARMLKRQTEIMYNNIVRKGMQEQRRTYKTPEQKFLDTYEVQKKANKNKEEIIQAMTNTINEVGVSNVSKHCADFNIVNVVDIPHSSLGENRENFKSEAIKLLGKTNVLDENNCYHIVIYQQDSKEK